jgi:hypothetical protein
VDILYPAWMKKNLQEYGYGFPFTYSISLVREWPWSFVADFVIGVALLRFVEWQYERFVRKPHTPA